MTNNTKNSNEIYAQTGTLAPLLNKREYTDVEKTVLLHFFTNVDKNVYCATDALSSQLWAFLVGQYSRTEVSMRDRFLQLFEDAKKAYEKGQIEKDEYVSLEDLAGAIKSGQFKTIEYFNTKASAFLKKWGVDYGHNSLKDADRIRFAIENVSQVFTKVIESPFPALGDFQEKSTRYMNFGKESIIYSPTLLESDYADDVVSLNNELMDLYEKYLPIVKEVLVHNKVIEERSFKRKDAFERTLNAKAFDIMRYALPTGVSTSLGASFSARTCESHISEMLSHPLKEVRLIAKSMHVEALKISEGLLSHVGESDFLKTKMQKAREVSEDVFYTRNFDEIHKGIEDCNRVKIVKCDDIDNMVAASILFENGRKKGVSFLDCQNRVELMNLSNKKKIIESYIGERGIFDRMPRALQHGSVIFEFLCDFGAYRDIQRHRASPQLWQGAVAVHGYDYPEYIDLMGMEDFKKDYDEIMTKITEFSRKIIGEFPDDIEYVAALGHLVRTTFEMHSGQLVYVSELRTTPQGHHSYRNLFKQVYREMQKKAPLLSEFIRVNLKEIGTRQKQEEKAAEKREKLGLN